MDLNTLISQLSPQALAFITQLLQQGDQQTIDEILQIAQQAGVPAVEQAIQEFMQMQGMDPSGGQPPVDPTLGAAPPMDPSMMGGPPVPPPGMAPPGMDPSMGMPPPGMDPAMAGLPPGMAPPNGPMVPPGAPPNGSVPPPLAQQLQQPRQSQPKKKKVPKYKLPPLREREAPTLDEILDDARAGREFWAPRDERIRKDYALYHLEYDNRLFGQRTSAVVGGTVLHRRSQPNTLVNLVTSLATAKNDQLTVEMEPRSDQEEYKSASQAAEDYVLYSRECDEERWLETRVAEMPLPRKEAGLAALEGGIGWTWYIDPDDEEHPIKYELVPLSQLYDLGDTCTRQYTVPLHKARREWDAIKKAYPAGSKFDPNQLVRIIIHMDNDGIYKSVVWEEVGNPTRARYASNAGGFAGSTPSDKPSAENKDRQWIQKPQRVNFGFRGYSYVVWGGSPAEMLQGQERSHIAYKGYGVLTMLRKTFRLMDLFISAVATGALSAIDPAIYVETEEPDHLKIQRPDRKPGGFTVYPAGTKLNPLVWEVSKNADAMNLMNSLIAELADIQNPALSGAPGASGIAQQINTDQASQQVIGPLVDALEKWYALMHKQRLILALRYSDDDNNKDDKGEAQTFFDSYVRRSYREPSYGEYGELRPKDIEMSGTRVKVRYHNKNTQEDMAIAQMVSTLTQAHLMSQETALRKMGVKNPQQELQRILADGAFMEPAVLKALVETAVYNSGNPTLIAAWEKAFAAEAMQGQGPPQAGQPGVASMPGPANQPGMNAQGTSSAVQAPGAQQVGMMQ